MGQALKPHSTVEDTDITSAENTKLGFCCSEAPCDFSGTNPTLNLQQFGHQPETGLANRFHLAASHPLLQNICQSKVAGVSALVERSALLSHYQVGGADRIWGS